MVLRILSHVNFSNLRDPASDSGVQVQASLINTLLKQNSDLYFYVLTPEQTLPVLQERLTESSVCLLPTPMPARQSGGAFHFDTATLDSVIDFRSMDFDVLHLNQPELTPAFLDYFNKRRFYDIPAVSYIHWFDWRRWDHLKNISNDPASILALTGAVLSHRTGCNSEYGRQRILAAAARWFGDHVLEELAERLCVLPPGIDVPEILAGRARKTARTVQLIVPHRAQKYTGFKTLVERWLPAVWARRQDFRVVLTNPSRYDYVNRYPDRYPFIKIKTLSRRDYIAELWRSDIVLGTHKGSNQWSISTLEAICAECVPLLNREAFFGEMIEPCVPPSERDRFADRNFYFRAEFPNRLLDLLDSLDEEKVRVRELARRARNIYDWRARAADWLSCFRSADAEAPVISARSAAYRKIVDFIAEGPKSKADILRYMGWHPKSRHISWTKYRRALRTDAVERADGPTSVFEPKPAD